MPKTMIRPSGSRLRLSTFVRGLAEALVSPMSALSVGPARSVCQHENMQPPFKIRHDDGFSIYPHARGIAGRDAYLSVGRIKDRPRRQPVPIAGYRGAIRV